MKIFAVTRMSHDTCGNSWPTEKLQTMFIQAKDADTIRKVVDKKLAFTTFDIHEIKIEASYLNVLHLLDTDTYCTFDEWKARGRCVLKGAKSFRRNDQGEPVFSEQQTKEQPLRPYYTDYPEDDDDWMDQEF